MFQLYQSFLLYSFTFLSLSLQQLYWIHKKKDLKIIKDLILFRNIPASERMNEIKHTFLYTFFYLITFVLSVIGGSILPVEFFAIFKRTGSIISSFVIDKFLFNKNINIWNTYLLLCVKNGVKLEQENEYLIERNQKGFRKYVIMSKDDLKRIPFLDSSELDIFDVKQKKITESKLGNIGVKSIYKIINNKDLSIRKFEKGEIEKMVDEIIEEMEA